VFSAQHSLSLSLDGVYVRVSWWKYGVRKILGLKYGFEGLNPAISQVIELNPSVVRGLFFLRFIRLVVR
jgi:hypothetical protein